MVTILGKPVIEDFVKALHAFNFALAATVLTIMDEMKVLQDLRHGKIGSAIKDFGQVTKDLTDPLSMGKRIHAMEDARPAR